MPNSDNALNKPTGNRIVLEVCGHQIPSFKNRKHSGKNGFVYTEPQIKQRMAQIENAMLSALFSECQIIANETHSECWKRLRIALSGLSDDSILEIPEGSWAIERCEKGSEGIRIEITTL